MEFHRGDKFITSKYSGCSIRYEKNTFLVQN